MLKSRDQLEYYVTTIVIFELVPEYNVINVKFLCDPFEYYVTNIDYFCRLLEYRVRI